MIGADMAKFDKELEEKLLMELRARYEGEGYKFIVHPTAKDMPEFLRGYHPDAVALSEKDKIVIELTGQPPNPGRLSELTRSIERQPGWRVMLYRFPGRPQLYDKPAVADLRAQFEEAKKVFAAGYGRAAFVLGWATLEALARAISPNNEKTEAMTPPELISWLEQQGYIAPETRHKLRELIPVRNAVIHGSREVQFGKQHWTALERVLKTLLDQVDTKR
jgi:uncharacterized protein YutE (UPF0331/DUF86 family)